MLIYDKKPDKIDIYTMEPNKEKLEKYRKRAVQRYKDDLYLCYLKTNNWETISRMKNASAIDNHLVNYDNSTPLDCGTWANIYITGEEQGKNLILEKYIAGEYDKLAPTRVFEYEYEAECEKRLYNLLKTEGHYISSTNSHGDVYQMDNMLNLPENLYLLHQLLLGKYASVADENITRLLKLFEFEYQKNVELQAIEEMLATGLVSGTIDRVIKKAEVGSKVLRKALVNK